VAATVDLDAIPVAAAVRALFPENWLDLATRGGEDYELLLTIPPERFPLLRDAVAGIGQTLTAIGTIGLPSDNPGLSARTETGDLVDVSTGAFDHFRS
jgi:thiamine-monophosphate kinase